MKDNYTWASNMITAYNSLKDTIIPELKLKLEDLETVEISDKTFKIEISNYDEAKEKLGEYLADYDRLKDKTYKIVGLHSIVDEGNNSDGDKINKNGSNGISLKVFSANL